MPVRPDAAIEVSAYDWVPDFAKGLVRDLRVRWALEEAGLSYRERLLNPRAPRPQDYLQEQPFGQVPAYRDDEVHLFETGAIVLHIAEDCEALAPKDAVGRARTMSWVFAALNSIEPWLMELIIIDIFTNSPEWGQGRRAELMELIHKRLGQLSTWLGDKPYLEGRFTAGDLMMTTVLRMLRHADILADYPTLVAYQARCEARPAFKAALDAQLAAFRPEPATA
jgi:glutathione S-transferase